MTTAAATVLVMAFVTIASSESVNICEPRKMQDMQNLWTSIGTGTKMHSVCQNSYTNNGLEVHLLHLDFSKNDSIPTVFFDLSGVKPAHFIFSTTSSVSIGILDSKNVTRIVTNDHNAVYGREATAMNIPTDNKDFVAWAIDNFGGVTSLTTFTDPQRVLFSASQESVATTRPPKKSQSDPVPLVMQLFMSEDYTAPIDPTIPVQRHEFIYAEISSSVLGEIVLLLEVTNCSAMSRSGSSAGVLHLPFSEEQCPQHICRSSTRLSFSLESLQGYDTLTSWELECAVKMCAGKIGLHTACVSGAARTDLEIVSSLFPLPKSRITAPPAVKRGTASDNPKSDQAPLLMQLFTSPDYRAPIEATTPVQSDKPVYVEISSNALGEIVLQLQVANCTARSRSTCGSSMALQVVQQRCSPQDCRHSTRLSLSLQSLQKSSSSSWELECFVKMCTTTSHHPLVCVNGGNVNRSLEITLSSLPTTRQCVEFGLSAVLAVAFGGFLTGILLVGALWFVKVRTGYPCWQTKQDPTSGNPPPSENSSANGSIDSTQSTPTSSMA